MEVVGGQMKTLGIQDDELNEMQLAWTDVGDLTLMSHDDVVVTCRRDGIQVCRQGTLNSSQVAF